MVRVQFRLQGEFDEERFNQALLLCKQVVPELFCRYQLATNSFIPITDDLSQILFKEADPDEGIDDWDLFTQPQWRVYLNKQTDGVVVTIFLSHILTDGAGAKQLLNLLAKAYNTGSLAGITNHTDVEWLTKLLAEHPVESNGRVDHPQKPLSLPKLAASGQQIRRVNQVYLAEEETQELIKAAHKTGVTLNDLFMASFGQAVQRFSQTNQISLACPTDMRKFIPGKPQIRVANHTTRYNVQVPSDPQAPFEEVVRAIHVAMAKNKESFQCLQSVKDLMAKAAHGTIAELQELAEKNYHVRTISYTNLAIIDSQAFRFDGCSVEDFCMIGSYRQMPMFQVAVSTFKGRICLAYGMIGNDQEKQFGDAILLIMRDLLRLYSGNIATE